MNEIASLVGMGASGAMLLELFWLRSQYGRKTPQAFDALIRSKLHWTLTLLIVTGSGLLTWIIMDGPPQDHLLMASINGAAIRSIGKEGLSALVLNQSHKQGSTIPMSLREIFS